VQRREIKKHEKIASPALGAHIGFKAPPKLKTELQATCDMLPDGGQLSRVLRMMVEIFLAEGVGRAAARVANGRWLSETEADARAAELGELIAKRAIKKVRVQDAGRARMRRGSEAEAG